MRLVTFRDAQGERRVGALGADGAVRDLAVANAVLPAPRPRAGIGFQPPRFPKAGDVVRIEMSRIGVLENPVG